MKSNIFQKIQNSKLAQIGICFIFIIAYFFLSFKKYDIAPSDEDVYLLSGMHFNLPFLEFGNFFQSLGYFLVSKFTISNIDTMYYYNFIVSSLVFLASVFFLKNGTRNYYISLVISACFLFSYFQINQQPRITFLTLLFGYLFLSRIKSDSSKYFTWGILSICFLLCLYVSRPEFFHIFILSFLLFVFYLYYDKSLSKKYKMLLFLALSSLILLLYYLGGGIYPESKLKLAFIQHFFDNYYIWTGEKFDYHEEFVVFEKIYGTVNSNLDIITVNPPLFFKHVYTNIFTYFEVLIAILKSTFYDPLIPYFLMKTKFANLVIMLFFGFFIDFKSSFQKIKNIVKEYNIRFYFLFLFMIPGFLASAIVLPREHYVLMHLPFYFLIIAMVFASLSFKKKRSGKWLKGAFAVIILIGVLSSFKRKSNTPMHLDFYEYMRHVDSKQKLNILSNDRFGFYYFGNNMTRNRWDAEHDDLVEIINSDKYDILVLYSLDLEVPSNRKFVKEGQFKTDYVRIEKFESLQRYIWVHPEKAYLFQ